MAAMDLRSAHANGVTSIADSPCVRLSSASSFRAKPVPRSTAKWRGRSGTVNRWRVLPSASGTSDSCDVPAAVERDTIMMLPDEADSETVELDASVGGLVARGLGFGLPRPREPRLDWRSPGDLKHATLLLPCYHYATTLPIDFCFIFSPCKGVMHDE